MIKAILFDKDGTLVKFNQVWIEPTKELIKKYSKDSKIDNIEEILMKEIGIDSEDKVVENGVLAAGTTLDVTKVLADVLGLDFSTIKEDVSQSYLEYLKSNSNYIKGIGDLKDLLTKLKQKGIYTGVVTADSYNTTNFMLEYLGIKDKFDFIATSDIYKEKPAPDALYEFCEKFNLKPDEVVFVGDSAVDMEFGKHTKFAIGVLSGAGTKEMLQTHTPYVIDSVMDIWSLDKLWI